MAWNQHPLEGDFNGFLVEVSDDLLNWVMLEDGALVRWGNVVELSTADSSGQGVRFYRLNSR